jgi:uncharacterized membrane protein YeiH
MSFSFFESIEILGTASFAVSGTSAAIKKRLDIFGVIVIAFATSIGGGTLRDILLGASPVAWLQDQKLVAVVFLAATCTLFVDSSKRIPKTLFLFDTLGLGLFTIAGIDKAIEFGLSPVMCIAIGTINACFGGVIRDVLLNNVPLIFHREIYACACIAGGALYFICGYFNMGNVLAQLVSMLVVVIIRILALRFHLSLPSFHLSPSDHET